ncbi:choloylglycine hydrolase [Vibrio coralliilyticus]|uniref:choloylglycine hydrolase n=1 Tax=Vibrio coralliilyticus TaxID=190893 RepID=UPI00156163E6|nr:choloylglycine hydrolase [Vibrio coralliilyticus]NRF16503.1 choloylglycine hydrolase [Vibrio coralliilyticus]
MFLLSHPEQPMPHPFISSPLAFQISSLTWFRTQQVFEVSVQPEPDTAPLRAIWSGQFAFSHQTFPDALPHDLMTQQGKNEAGLQLALRISNDKVRPRSTLTIPTNAFVLSQAHIGTFILSAFDDIDAMVRFFCSYPVYVVDAPFLEANGQTMDWQLYLSDAHHRRAVLTKTQQTLHIHCSALPPSLVNVTHLPFAFRFDGYQVVIDTLPTTNRFLSESVFIARHIE